MSKRFALITGASGGIGKALCEDFATAGWNVIATSRKPLPKSLKGVKFIEADLVTLTEDTDALKAFAKNVRDVIGADPLNAIINNAAVQTLGGVEDISINDMIRSYSVNVLAPFLLTKTFLAELEVANGSVLNIGTVHAQATKQKFIAYATTKTAMHGLTRALAIDLGGRVRVNTLAPAATATPMLMAGFEGQDDAFKDLADVHPVGRIANPSEVSDAALFLCSDNAQFITGTTLYIDGGILSRLHDPV